MITITAKDSKLWANGEEHKLYDAARKRLQELGALVLKIHGGIYQERAVDLIICYRGRYVAEELKAGRNTASSHQELFLKKVQNAGGKGIVCWSVAQCLEPLMEIDKELEGE